MKVDFKVFKELVEELEESNLFYVVFGGFGLDGRRGKITRNHKDVDIYCFKKDFSEFKDLLFELNYEFYYEVNNLKAFRKEGLKLDLCLLEKIGKKYITKLRHVKIKIPIDLLEENIQKTSIKNCYFNVVPDEILKKDGLGSQYPEDVEYVKNIEVDDKL